MKYQGKIEERKTSEKSELERGHGTDDETSYPTSAIGALIKDEEQN